MQYFIREWPNHTASLVAEDGHILATFGSVREAFNTCARDCMTVPAHIERRSNYLEASPIDFDSTFLN
ncbi:MAG: hypothetical protein RLZZ385_387 [Pseudomonadota bacterium]|jgi:hypothetical protein